MILDASAFEPAVHTTRTQVCVVGAGAAGITLACELDGSGVDVLLVEAGGASFDEDIRDDYVGYANDPHPDPTQFRRAGFGGTTAIWGGRCVPLDPIDFERRDHVPDSGWPVDYGEVSRYYPAAMRYCDAGHADFSVSGSLHKTVPTIDGLESKTAVLADRIERYSRPTNFGTRYYQQINQSKNVTALLYARCVQLVRAPDADRLGHLIIVDKGGRRISIEAEMFVLAGGGLEVTRLLLDSDKQGPGLGNRYDKLGRYYACHFENICARLIPGRTRVPFAFEKTVDGVYARRKLQFSDQAQRRHRLLNSAFRLHFPPYSDAGHGSAVMSMIYVAKAALVREHALILAQGRHAAIASPVGAHLRNIALGLPQLCRFGLEWVFLRQLAQRKLPYTLVPNADGSYPLEFNSEQTPLAASRVSLTHERDRHGMRRIRVDWWVSQDDIDAAYRAFVLLRTTLHQYSSCRLEFDDSNLYTSLNNSVPLGGHHIGSTRMAANARAGVVDRHCALFELPNLYVASASVFPTSGHANPTLTIVALAIRLAEHLKEKLRRHAWPAREQNVHT